MNNIRDKTQLKLKKGNQVMNTKTDVEQLNEKIEKLSSKLNEIKTLALKQQGRWYEVASTECPATILPYKKLLEIIEN